MSCALTRPVVRVFVNTAHAAHPWGSIVSGISRYAKMSGWTVQTSFRIENAPAERRRDKTLFRHYRPDGIIATYCEGLREALPADIPVVWLDPQPGRYPEKDDCIFHDNEETARLAAKELLALQVQHYAAVGVNDYSLWSTRRINVFRECVLAACKTFRSVELNVSDRDTASRYRLLEPFLLSLPKPCAIFAVCDTLALDVISIAARLGIVMPDELAVLGMDKFRQRFGLQFDYPTEAQWEFACRAGTDGRYHGFSSAGECAWYSGNSGNALHPVGQKKPNAWGLYDMLGNAFEYCLDGFSANCGLTDAQLASETVDPYGPYPLSDDNKPMRGGSYGKAAYECRSGDRSVSNHWSSNWGNTGFRLVCPLPGETFAEPVLP